MKNADEREWTEVIEDLEESTRMLTSFFDWWRGEVGGLADNLRRITGSLD